MNHHEPPNEHERFAIPDDLASIDDALRDLADAEAASAPRGMHERIHTATLDAHRTPAPVLRLHREDDEAIVPARRFFPVAAAAMVVLTAGMLIGLSVLRIRAYEEPAFGFAEASLLVEVDSFFAHAMDPAPEAFELDEIESLRLEVAAFESSTADLWSLDVLFFPEGDES